MSRPPLAGLRVLAVSQFGAGPFGTTVLADLGAEIIKIEDPAVGGDVARYVPPFLIEQDSLYFQSFNRLMAEQVLPSTDVEETTDEAVAPPWMTILHNCECHTFEQVVRQLQKAIACSEAEGWEIAWQVHNTGKAVVKVGPETECVRVGNILASIGLVVTVVQS